jgi:hypothetical protein
LEAFQALAGYFLERGGFMSVYATLDGEERLAEFMVQELGRSPEDTKMTYAKDPTLRTGRPYGGIMDFQAETIILVDATEKMPISVAARLVNTLAPLLPHFDINVRR